MSSINSHGLWNQGTFLGFWLCLLLVVWSGRKYLVSLCINSLTCSNNTFLIGLFWALEIIHEMPRVVSGIEAIFRPSQVVLVVKNLPAKAGDIRRRFDPWVRKIPWRRAWQSTPVFLPGESHRQRSLLGYSPSSHEELNTTEATYHAGRGGFQQMILIYYYWKLSDRLSLLVDQYNRNNVTILSGLNLMSSLPDIEQQPI